MPMLLKKGSQTCNQEDDNVNVNVNVKVKVKVKVGQ